jgi:hypothetical protein
MSIAPAKDPVVSSATVPAAKHEPLCSEAGASARRSPTQEHLADIFRKENRALFAVMPDDICPVQMLYPVRSVSPFLGHILHLIPK